MFNSKEKEVILIQFTEIHELPTSHQAGKSSAPISETVKVAEPEPPSSETVTLSPTT